VKNKIYRNVINYVLYYILIIISLVYKKKERF